MSENSLLNTPLHELDPAVAARELQQRTRETKERARLGGSERSREKQLAASSTNSGPVVVTNADPETPVMN